MFAGQLLEAPLLLAGPGVGVCALEEGPPMGPALDDAAFDEAPPPPWLPPDECEPPVTNSISSKVKIRIQLTFKNE
jgi:hypothetical protein